MPGNGDADNPSMKITLISLAFAAIIAALVFAGVFMMRSGSVRGRDKHMARALAFRVGLSVLLFVCILLAYEFGWIEPTGVPLAK
jgi:uncharacterized membrane protein YjgN (DUF898 family)